LGSLILIVAFFLKNGGKNTSPKKWDLPSNISARNARLAN
jgi:hypothetical protein